MKLPTQTEKPVLKASSFLLHWEWTEGFFVFFRLSHFNSSCGFFRGVSLPTGKPRFHQKRIDHLNKNQPPNHQSTINNQQSSSAINHQPSHPSFLDTTFPSHDPSRRIGWEMKQKVKISCLINGWKMKFPFEMVPFWGTFVHFAREKPNERFPSFSKNSWKK